MAIVVEQSDSFEQWRQKTNQIGAAVEDSASTGNIALLTTTANSNVVIAVNELDSSIGTLSSLTTTDKTSLVAAANELGSRIDDTVDAIGNLGSLRTTANSNVVVAVNELDSRLDSLGTLASQNTAPVSMGGTGRTTLTTNALVAGAGTSAVNLIAPGTNGNVLVSDGTAWKSQAIATGGGTVTSISFSGGTTGMTVTGSPVTISGTITLTGNLLVPSGGTGRTTLTAGSLLVGNGTAGVNFIAPGTVGNVLVSDGTNWVSQAASGGGEGSVTSVNVLGGSTGLTTTGGPITSTGNITLGGTLNVASGGTGRSTLTNGYFLVGNGTSAVQLYTVASVRTALGLGELALKDTVSLSGTEVTGTLPVSKGGTNATTTTDARTNLGLGTTNSVQFSSLGVGTSASGTTGEIRATNNITAYYSDDRLKTRIGNIQNALEKVNSLNGFYYEANELAQELGYEKKPEVGVSAQEVQAIMPEVVVPAPIDDKYLTVRYEKLIPLLIESIKELTQEVNELKKRLGE